MNKLVSLSLSLVFTVLVVFSAPALAINCTTCSGSSNLTSQQAIECGTSCASGNTNTPAQASKSLNATIKNVVNILSIFVGIIAVIMIIAGGLRYVTSGGSTEKVGSAKNTILYAVIGLIVTALAQVIVRFVLNKAVRK